MKPKVHVHYFLDNFLSPPTPGFHQPVTSISILKVHPSNGPLSTSSSRTPSSSSGSSTVLPPQPPLRETLCQICPQPQGGARDVSEHLLPRWSPWYCAYREILRLLSKISDALDISPDFGLPPGLKKPSSPLPLPPPDPKHTRHPTPPSLDCSLLSPTPSAPLRESTPPTTTVGGAPLQFWHAPRCCRCPLLPLHSPASTALPPPPLLEIPSPTSPRSARAGCSSEYILYTRFPLLPHLVSVFLCIRAVSPLRPIGFL